MISRPAAVNPLNTWLQVVTGAPLRGPSSVRPKPMAVMAAAMKRSEPTRKTNPSAQFGVSSRPDASLMIAASAPPIIPDSGPSIGMMAAASKYSLSSTVSGMPAVRPAI